MNWSDIAGAVGKAAPILGTLVGGPAGAAIGGVIASALGTENTPEAVNAALQANPDAFVKLKQIESDERVKLQQMALAHADNALAADTAAQAAEVEDRKSARARDMAYVAAGKQNRRADIMVAVDAIGLIACLVALAFFRTNLPENVAGLLTTIATLFGLCLRDAHNFEFGSSRGSAEKTQLMAKTTPAAEPNAVNG